MRFLKYINCNTIIGSRVDKIDLNYQMSVKLTKQLRFKLWWWIYITHDKLVNRYNHTVDKKSNSRIKSLFVLDLKQSELYYTNRVISYSSFPIKLCATGERESINIFLLRRYFVCYALGRLILPAHSQLK